MRSDSLYLTLMNTQHFRGKRKGRTKGAMSNICHEVWPKAKALLSIQFRHLNYIYIIQMNKAVQLRTHYMENCVRTKFKSLEMWKRTEQNLQCNFKADSWHHLQPCTICGKTDNWIFLRLLRKTLKVRDCNQSKRKRENSSHCFLLAKLESTQKMSEGVLDSHSLVLLRSKRGRTRTRDRAPPWSPAVTQSRYLSASRKSVSTWEENNPSPCEGLCKTSV